MDEPYYLANFDRLLVHAETVYWDLLLPAERATIVGFRALPVAARCLYVRLLGRKGPWLRIDALDYPEVGDIADALAILADAGFVALGPLVPAGGLLGLARAEELRSWAARLGLRRRSTVGHLRESLAERLPTCVVQRWAQQTFQWLQPLRGDWLDLLMLLFFGNRHQDLSTFVVAELGHVRYETVPGHGVRAFVDRADFAAFRELLDARAAAARAIASGDPLELRDAFARLRGCDDHPLAPTRRDRALVGLAEAMQRRGMPLAAAECAQAAAGNDAERRTRLALRKALGRAATRRTLTTRTAAICTRSLALQWTAGDVERATLAQLQTEGYRGAHTENRFVAALFGLLCWDAVFAPVRGAFFNPYQRGPVDLYDAQFAARREAWFAAVAEALRTGQWRARMQETARRKHGLANPFVAWREIDWPGFTDLCAGLRDEFVATVIDYVANEPRRALRGFPDLALRRGDGATEFCEVKSPNDQLSAAQRDWLRVIEQAGHSAWVARITTPATVGQRP